MHVTQYHSILEGVLHAVTSSVDFLPNNDQRSADEYPSVWDNPIPTWKIDGFSIEQNKGTTSDSLRVFLTWSATILSERHVTTTYEFNSKDFENDFGVRGLIMNFHDHVRRVLNLKIVAQG